jgi:hypothetical protein
LQKLEKDKQQGKKERKKKQTVCGQQTAGVLINGAVHVRAT